MTTTTMYDSDNIDDIPADAPAVMFYNDGENGTATVEQLQRFQGRPLVSCTRKVGVKAKVVDVEPGCVWPATDARQQIQSGDSDTVYCDWNNWNISVKEALVGLTFNLIIANYDGTAEIPVVPDVNVVGKQYCSETQPPQAPSGGHYDKSVVSAVWLGLETGEPPVTDTPVTPPEAEKPIEDADADQTLNAPIVDAVWVSGGCYMVASDGGVFCKDAAIYHGSVPEVRDAQGNPIKLHADIVSILVADHTGYTLVAADGGTFRFGNGPEIQAL